MSGFDKFMTFLQSEMPRPTAYGWYHILCIAIVAGLSIFLGIKLRNASEKAIRRFLLISSIIMLVFELYKQLIFSYDFANNAAVWDFQWYAFPFQFCSTPMYVALVASLIKKGKVQESMYAFLATFALFGGLIVMFVPGDVFIEYIGINIQTMVHHGLMVVIGVVLLTSKSVKLEHKSILKAACVFGALVATALLANCVYVWCGGTETFNMFFISPYFPSTLPVFNIIYEKVPYVVYLLLYIVAFMLIAYVVLLVAMLIKKLADKHRPKKASTQ